MLFFLKICQNYSIIFSKSYSKTCNHLFWINTYQTTQKNHSKIWLKINKKIIDKMFKKFKILAYFGPKNLNNDMEYISQDSILYTVLQKLAKTIKCMQILYNLFSYLVLGLLIYIKFYLHIRKSNINQISI